MKRVLTDARSGEVDWDLLALDKELWVAVLSTEMIALVP
jgi:hypothetical protein